MAIIKFQRQYLIPVHSEFSYTCDLHLLLILSNEICLRETMLNSRVIPGVEQKRLF